MHGAGEIWSWALVLLEYSSGDKLNSDEAGYEYLRPIKPVQDWGKKAFRFLVAKVLKD